MKWPLFGIILELGGVVEMFGRCVTDRHTPWPTARWEILDSATPVLPCCYHYPQILPTYHSNSQGYAVYWYRARLAWHPHCGGLDRRRHIRSAFSCVAHIIHAHEYMSHDVRPVAWLAPACALLHTHARAAAPPVSRHQLTPTSIDVHTWFIAHTLRLRPTLCNPVCYAGCAKLL